MILKTHALGNLPKPVLTPVLRSIMSFSRDRMKTDDSDNLIVLQSRQVALLNGSQEHEQRTRFRIGMKA